MKSIGRYGGLAYIVYFLASAANEVGNKTCEGVEYDWTFPLLILVFVGIPFILGFMANANGE
jgi:hypothetical protein